MKEDKNKFTIKVGKSEVIDYPMDSTLSISEIIEMSYTYDSFVNLFWNNFPIRLSYSIIGDIYEDILDMLEILKSSKKNFSICWPCNAFFANWDFTVINNKFLEIEAHWISVSGGEDVENELKNNIPTKLIIEKKVFMNEWYDLLDSIKGEITR